MNKILTIGVCAICAISATAQNRYGYVSDAKTGERLPNVLIYNKKSSASTLTNAYGYYSITKTTSQDTLLVRFMGYTTRNVVVGKESRQDIALEESNNQLAEVEVKAQSTFQRELATPQMSHHRVTAADIKSTPVLFGEADALKTIQFLPGVNSAADGSTNLSIRGGSYDENLVMLDEATVYNPSHSMGIFTAFNADAISGVDLYKGDIPARYGGKLSAVVDMQMKEGNNQDYIYQGSIGTIASRLMVEGPIKRDTASFMIAGRYGYSDLITKAFHIRENGLTSLGFKGYEFAGQHDNDKIRFYDICAKTNWTINKNNKVYASGYFSHDNFRYPTLLQDNEQKWGNQTATLRWNHIFNDKIFANTTLSYSNYRYRQRQTEDTRNFEWRAGMSEVVAKTDFDYYRDKMHITFGGSVEGHFYRPGEIVPLSDSSSVVAMKLQHKRTMQISAYAGNEHKIIHNLTLSYGLRFSSSFQLGPANVRHYTEMPQYNDSTEYGKFGLVKCYAGVEPRLGLSYALNDILSFKASYAHTIQYQHLLNNSALGSPTDIWAPADSYIRPQTADAVACGMHAFIPKVNIEASVEGYYKAMHHIIDFKDNSNLYLNENIETEILCGHGRAFGAEFMLRRDSRRSSFLVSYTLSKAERQIDGVNQGKWYYAVYDQRHNVSLSATLKLTKQLSCSATWRYHTGGRTTLPLGYVNYWGTSVMIYTERNGYKMPDFHRLDLSATYDFKEKQGQRFHSQLNFSLYNAYGRKNVYSMFVKGDTYRDILDEVHGFKVYLYQWVPSVTYSFKF